MSGRAQELDMQEQRRMRKQLIEVRDRHIKRLLSGELTDNEIRRIVGCDAKVVQRIRRQG